MLGFLTLWCVCVCVYHMFHLNLHKKTVGSDTLFPVKLRFFPLEGTDRIKRVKCLFQINQGLPSWSIFAFDDVCRDIISVTSG